MKRLIVIFALAFAVCMTVVALSSGGTTDAKDSITYNDNAGLNFSRTYTCQIMSISITGPRNLNIQDSQHMTVTLVYVPPLNPHTEITVTPTSCAPGG